MHAQLTKQLMYLVVAAVVSILVSDVTRFVSPIRDDLKQFSYRLRLMDTMTGGKIFHMV